MRDDERKPVPRGTVLVAEGQTGSTGTAQPPANPAPATDSDHESAVNEGSGGPGAARADEVPGPSHTTHPAADPGQAAEGTPANSAGGAPAGTKPGQAPEASQPGAATPAAHSDAAVDESIGGRVVQAPPGSAVANRSPGSAAVKAPRRAPEPEPSWGKVLATTVSLWTTRRLSRLRGSGRPSGAAGGAPAAIAGARAHRSGFRWPLVVFVLVLVILALVGLQLSGALSQHDKGQTASGSRGGTGASSGSDRALQAAQAMRSQAATWVAQQITASTMIACDSAMCSALEADGVPAARLLTVQATTPDPLGADVVVATAAIRTQFGRSLTSEYAPQLLATFGSGASRVDVRAVAADGAAAFNQAEANDLAQRKTAGAQLIHSDSLIGEKDAGQIRAGHVDSRLLITLASLLSQRPVDVGAFEVTGPGAPILYREVTIVDAPGQSGTSALQADLNQVRTQPSSYHPLHAEIVQLANGQSALRIEFGAPDPPGLLSGGGNS